MVGPSVFPDTQLIPKWLVLQYFQIQRLYRNAWSFSISRYTSYTKTVGFSVFPDSHVLEMTDDPISHLFQIFHTCSTHFFTFFTFWARIPIPASSIQKIFQSMSCGKTQWHPAGHGEGGGGGGGGGAGPGGGSSHGQGVALQIESIGYQ